MPSQEFKRIFQAGRMNRDLDDRLVPNGEYREALNVNIGRAEGADIGAVENLLGNEEILNPEAIPNGFVLGTYRDNGNERIYFFVTNNFSADETNSGEHGIFEFDQTTRLINVLASGSGLNFHFNSTITGVNFVDDLLFWTDNRNQPRKINVTRGRNTDVYRNVADSNEFDDRGAVAKYAPVEAPAVTGTSTAGNDSNFLQDKLIRFAYRWKFEDGEFSTISPFSPICFIPPTVSTTTNQAAAVGEIPDLVNALKQVSLSVPTPQGFGITEVELIYKETAITTIYIIDDAPVDPTSDNVSFTYNSQDPFRALPGSQLTRVYDAVPRLAKSQEFAGGRIVYGNFLQNRDIPDISFSVGVTSADDQRHSQFRNQSVKSRRTYQVGVVLADRYGRQSPVILSSTGGDTIFIDAQTGNASDVFQKLVVNFTSEVPDWAHSYRIVVKQREQEYYNVFGTASSSGISRNGDTVNKIPRDVTAGDETASAASVYPKLFGSENQTGAELLSVTSISPTGATSTFNVPGAPTTGVVVYETEPVISNLDIFFETSTGGLVPENRSIGQVDVEFYNCHILDVGTGHIEVNRLRAGFNEPSFDVGVRANIVQENFAEERRFNTLIHSSGLFNSRRGVNQVNQFNEGEGGITLSLDPQDGSIQKLYAEDTQMIIWQEDKVSRSPIDKDFIYSAEGGAVPVTSNTQYLGTVAPYVGEYGISTNPESFAVYGTRKYFTDRNRGVVLRLSNDGLTEISKLGMNDFFRSSLRTATRIIGSFDEYHDVYNLTIVGDNYTSDEDTNIATSSDGYFTISFEEDVRGWSSFKSFRQESGSTLNNTYYTFNGGRLWEHNSIITPRNSFYGQLNPSTLEFIFNDSPSVVKEFKTLSYEGTGGWDCDSLVTDFEQLGTQPTLTNTVSATLQISQGSILENTDISGARTISGQPGDTVTWILRAESTDVNSQFVDTDDDPITRQFSATPVIPINGLLIGSATENNGDGFIIVSYTLDAVSALIPINVTATPETVFVGNFLVVNVLDNITNTTISPSFIGLSRSDFTGTPETAQIQFVIFADQTPEAYYFRNPLGPNGEVVDNIQDVLGDLIVGDVTESLLEGDLAFSGSGIRYSFNVSPPAVASTESISISGNGPTVYARLLVSGNATFINQDDIPNADVFTRIVPQTQQGEVRLTTVDGGVNQADIFIQYVPEDNFVFVSPDPNLDDTSFILSAVGIARSEFRIFPQNQSGSFPQNEGFLVTNVSFNRNAFAFRNGGLTIDIEVTREQVLEAIEMAQADPTIGASFESDFTAVGRAFWVSGTGPDAAAVEVQSGTSTVTPVVPFDEDTLSITLDMEAQDVTFGVQSNSLGWTVVEADTVNPDDFVSLPSGVQVNGDVMFSVSENTSPATPRTATIVLRPTNSANITNITDAADTITLTIIQNA